MRFSPPTVPLRQSGYSLSASGGEGRGEVAFLLRSSASIGLLPLRLWGRGPGERWLFFCVPPRQSGYSLSASGGEGRGEVAFLLPSSASIGLLPLRLWGRGPGRGGFSFAFLCVNRVTPSPPLGERARGVLAFLCLSFAPFG